MPALEREGSRDRGAVVRQQHSFDSGRGSVPMWDSSDPERAPPPLPLNPSHGSPTTKANTSAGIAAAAKQIVERARESAPISSYTTNQSPPASPERSLVKGAHKRMQSLQTTSVKDLRSYLDNNRSPERSPERPSSRSGVSSFSRATSVEDYSSTPDRSTTPTPAAKDVFKDTPVLRPTTRAPPRPLLGENTPPSATMLALQTMQVPEPPLSEVTNGQATPSGGRLHTNYDFSSQLLNLTTIATNLQKEMSQLSRRSKDNATDLISLKEATNLRDEDIRKSLRELSTSVNSTHNLLGPPPVARPSERSPSVFSTSHYLESKPFSSPPSASKSYTLPRAASAHSFLDEPRCGSPSPSPYSVEGVASVAMLEKIIREMVTKEGQERLLSTLSELLEKSRRENVEAAKKVEQLSEFIKDKSESHALVPVRNSESGAPQLDLNFDTPRGAGKTGTARSPVVAPAANDEVMKLLERVKDSITHSGGTTSEVKGLVRDLRGEVLGMGRELGKKLDQIGHTQLNSTLDRSIEESQGSQHAEEVQRIVEEGLAELKQHMAEVMRNRVEQDDSTFKQLVAARSGPNGNDMLAAVKHALNEHSFSIEKSEDEVVNSGLDREGVLDAVKEGLKDFEPNIELQQFGLERDEILAVLKEGLQDYQNERSVAVSVAPGIDKGELFEVVQEALKDFRAPLATEQITDMKEELLANVRQALEEFEPRNPSQAPVDHEAMHAAVLAAVGEGLATHGPAAPRELEISRDDLFDAVKASLDGSAIPFGGFGEQVLAQMRELIDNMRLEFKQYSAASGRDTEQVLDAVNDGLEKLRAEVEMYVDRAQDVTGKDEIVDTVRSGLEQLRGDVQGYCAEGPSHDNGRDEMLEYIKAEFEQLHGTIRDRDTGRGLDGSSSAHGEEMLLAIRDCIDAVKSHGDARSVDESSMEELNEAMKAEFEQLRTAIINANAVDKGELIETIQDSMGALHSKLGGSELSTLSGDSVEEVLRSIRPELATLKESIHEMISNVETDGIVSGVRRAIDDLRLQLSADQNEASIEALGAIKEELERFRESMGSALVVGSSGTHGEALEAIRCGLEDVKQTTSRNVGAGLTDEQLEAIRGEFENLRNSIAVNLARSGSNEEVLDALRLGLDDLRSHLEKKLENPEIAMSHHSQVLDTLNDGLETLRVDIVKTLDKPQDMTVNYEILETLKDGIADLRAGMDKLTSGNIRPKTPQGGEIVLADGGAVDEASASPTRSAPAETNHSEFERMEVLLAQVQIKVEAMHHNLEELPLPQSAQPAEGTAMKQDLASLEDLLRQMQDDIAIIAGRDLSAPEGAARKEDTDAIETLLRNTKAQLEEMALPGAAGGVTKEHFDEMQTMIQVTNDAVESISDKLESSTACKADVAVVEVLAQDLKTSMEEFREKLQSWHDENPDTLTRADFDVLGVLCSEIKVRVHEMELPAPDEVASKSDIEQLQGLISDFRESHEKLRDSYETDIAVTAKAFDDRKQEFDDTITHISEVKVLIDEVKAELLDKMMDGESGLNTLGETIKSIEERTGDAGVIPELKEALEKVKEEFERAHASLDDIKIDHAASAETIFEKQTEHKDAVISQLSEKLDSLFDGMMVKYDDAQLAAEEKAKAMEQQAAEQRELFDSTKTMADDLKLSIDTLGTALTNFMGDLPVTMERMSDDSKTMAARVERTHNKLEETAAGLQGEHNATREEVAKVLAAIDGVQSDMSEHNPRFMVTLGEVRALINQHYEHSQRTAMSANEHAQAVRDLQDQLRAGFEAQTDGLKTHKEELRSTLPALMPPPTEIATADTAMHEKLDRLVNHMQESGSRSVQMGRLDEIHEKVMATAAEVSAFVSAQNKQITSAHESKEKEAEEIALILERRLERKDQLEDDITVLNADKEALQHAIQALRSEKEALMAQKARLNADVSSLETALHIRRDELHAMDEKAAVIEKRMMDGVMNQSRMLLLAKSTKPPPPRKHQGRDLRVPSDASAVSGQTVTSSLPALKTSHALAMKSRPGLPRNNGATPNTAERRIMSLSQINHNVPTGAHAYGADRPSLAATGLSSLKRSQSVKTTHFMRKGSWAGKRTSLSSYNKENQETLSEREEEEEDEGDGGEDYNRVGEELDSEAGTERRTSYLSATDTSNTYATGSYLDGETPGSDDCRPHRDHRPRASYGQQSDMTFDSASYMTGSELDRRASLGSSADGVLGRQSHDHDDHDASDAVQQQPQQRHEPLRLEAPPKHVYAPPSDSGLGTDLPTALGSGVGDHDFK